MVALFGLMAAFIHWKARVGSYHKDEDELTSSRSFVGSSLAMATKRVDNKLISSYGSLIQSDYWES